MVIKHIKNRLMRKKIINDFESLSKVSQVFLATVDFKDLVQRVVDSVLGEVAKLGHDFHIAVLALMQDDKEKKYLKRISVSRTKTAQNVVDNLGKISFKEIVTPMSATQNYCIKAIKQRKHFLTHSYIDVLHPPYTKEHCQELQKVGGIKTTVVFPVIVKNQAIGIIIFSTKQNIKELTQREITFIESLTSIIGIAVENANLFEQVEKDKVALKKANKRLKEIDKLKDEFVSVASHELRTPMTAIKNYLWMAINRPTKPLAEDVKKQINIAYNSTERLIHLVNDMLTISRIEGHRIELQQEEVNLNQITKATYEELTPIADNEKIDFEFIEKSDPILVLGDRNKLREVVQNVIGNALKFTPANGTVKIVASVEDDCARLNISDTGPGIAEANIEKLFTKFTRLEHSYSKTKETGTGLGLYISKQIIELHHGKIKVESKLNKGSTFTICLPLAKK
jgi:signal transduction histidine kinase